MKINVRLQPSLTRHRIGLLKFANSQFEGAKNIKFSYVDMHGALKAILNTPVRNKSILEFKTKMEVMEILNLADGLDEMLTRVFMNSEYPILLVLFSLCHLSSAGSLISLMFFDGRASSGRA